MSPVEVGHNQEAINREFEQIWLDNDMSPANLINPVRDAGLNAADMLTEDPEKRVSTLHITDVTLRDGQQQQTNEVTTAERVAVFDSIISTGVDRVEIGHLGNGNGDQQLAGEIVRRVAEREGEDERYANVKLQVLFGSQENLIEEGIGVLQTAFQEQYGEDWQAKMADKVVVHVYDRVDENLTSISSSPYDAKESARRVTTASQHAIDAGFKHFSVSAEAATAVTPETAIQFYRSLSQYLVSHGAETVGANLANTYGYSANAEWNTATLAAFNAAVKYGFEPGQVTTSIHTHNDVDNAVGFSMGAIVAGFDRVEGTLTGMGERAGNVASVDVVARMVEAARHEEEQQYRASTIAQFAGRRSLSRTVQLDPGIITNINNWYSAGEEVSRIFGEHAEYRWRRTAVGNPYAHDNGSGPHDQTMRAAIENPVEHPPYRNYGWALATNNIFGRPNTAEVAIGDPNAVQKITVGNHAGGGSTRAVLDGSVQRADTDSVERATKNLRGYQQAILGRLANGTTVVAA
jgi:isopropylmalate/homocitrate/citramalate synthase